MTKSAGPAAYMYSYKRQARSCHSMREATKAFGWTNGKKKSIIGGRGTFGYNYHGGLAETPSSNTQHELDDYSH